MGEKIKRDTMRCVCGCLVLTFPVYSSVTLLRTGMYTLKGAKTELADRATQRQVGTEPRHKVSAVKSVTERVFFLVHMPSD